MPAAVYSDVPQLSTPLGSDGGSARGKNPKRDALLDVQSDRDFLGVVSQWPDGTRSPDVSQRTRVPIDELRVLIVEAMQKVLGDQGKQVAAADPSEDVSSFLGMNGSRTMRLLAGGQDNDEIARQCGASRKTVKRWIERIYRDLRIDTKEPLNPRVVAARHYYLAIGVPNTTE